MPRKEVLRQLNPKLRVQWDQGNYVFENTRGLMMNGNRRIHMNNWTLADLQAIVSYLESRNYVE